MTDPNYFYKQNVEPKEYRIQKLAYTLVKTPAVYHYDPTTKVLTMEKIPEMCVADMYGEDVPSEIFEMIRITVSYLYCNGIEYPDVTGYNFIYYQKKIWIIDFGDAFFRTKETNNQYLLDFMFNGKNEWNPEYL
jgi:tRNA A-37 threonylcarbamoyl transferase component Bud32